MNIDRTPHARRHRGTAYVDALTFLQVLDKGLFDMPQGVPYAEWCDKSMGQCRMVAIPPPRCWQGHEPFSFVMEIFGPSILNRR